MENFENSNYKGNSSKYHTGKPCIEKDCDNPAGTTWSPYWCFEHNVERIKRIDKSFEDIISSLEKKKKEMESERTE